MGHQIYLALVVCVVGILRVGVGPCRGYPRAILVRMREAAVFLDIGDRAHIENGLLASLVERIPYGLVFVADHNLYLLGFPLLLLLLLLLIKHLVCAPIVGVGISEAVGAYLLAGILLDVLSWAGRYHVGVFFCFCARF